MLSRSPIRDGEQYQVHSKGATLACKGYTLLLAVFTSRKTDRDPIDTDVFLAKLSANIGNIHSEAEATLLKQFQLWMAELGVSPESVQKDFHTVCPPFLVGDCLPCRQGEFCKHGHPRMRPGVVPLNHPMVLDGGECIHLGPGGVVKVAKILGYNPKNTNPIYPCLEVGDERDEGVKYCVRGSGCSFGWNCIYYHPPHETENWSSDQGRGGRGRGRGGRGGRGGYRGSGWN